MSSLSNIAWYKFRRNPLGVLGLSVIVIACAFSIMGYALLPDSTPFSNNMHLELSKQAPGFSTDVILIPNNQVKKVGFLQKMFVGQTALFTEIPIHLHRVSNDTLYYVTYDALQESQLINTPYVIESRTYYLGTDTFGRDLLSRILIGTRVSLSVGFISVFISLIIGITLGASAAYFRGGVDAIVMWLSIIWSIPTFLVILITLALGKGFGKSLWQWV